MPSHFIGGLTMFKLTIPSLAACGFPDGSRSWHKLRVVLDDLYEAHGLKEFSGLVLVRYPFDKVRTKEEKKLLAGQPPIRPPGTGWKHNPGEIRVRSTS